MFYPGEVLEINGDTAKITFMSPLKNNRVSNKQFWVWPTKPDVQLVHKNSILQIRPRLDVSSLSTIQLVVFELLNKDIIKKFADY